MLNRERTLPLSWICFSIGSSSTPPLRLVNSQLVFLPPVGIFNNLCSIIGLFALFVNVFTVTPLSTEVLNTSTQDKVMSIYLFIIYNTTGCSYLLVFVLDHHISRGQI